MLSTGLLAAAGVVSLALVGIWLQRRPDPVDTADAIVVLGGDPAARALTGADLYNSGIAGELWITGDRLKSNQILSAAETARFAAWQQGVPFDRQLLLASSSTWEDGQQIRATAYARGVSRLVIVTSWYHSRRAMCVISYQLTDPNIHLFYQPSTRTNPQPAGWLFSLDGWDVVIHELLALGYYWWRYGVSPLSC